MTRTSQVVTGRNPSDRGADSGAREEGAAAEREESIVSEPWQNLVISVLSYGLLLLMVVVALYFTWRH